MQLRADGLTCRRGGRTIFSDVSFALSPGEALLVTGRNGAGKSTLLAVIAGLLEPERGAVSVTGAGDRVPAECVHLVGARDGLKAALTPTENLRFAAAILGAPLRPPAEALALLGLPRSAADVPVSFLSAGQRRRVALARLLAAHRPVWLLDEPTNALDEPAQSLLAGLLADHRAGGGIVVAATHAPIDLPGAATFRLDPGPAEPDAAELGAEPAAFR